MQKGNNVELQKVLIGKGEIVKVGGLPFALCQDTWVESHPKNIAYLSVAQLEKASSPQPSQSTEQQNDQ